MTDTTVRPADLTPDLDIVVQAEHLTVATVEHGVTQYGVKNLTLVTFTNGRLPMYFRANVDVQVVR